MKNFSRKLQISENEYFQIEYCKIQSYKIENGVELIQSQSYSFFDQMPENIKNWYNDFWNYLFEHIPISYVVAEDQWFSTYYFIYDNEIYKWTNDRKDQCCTLDGYWKIINSKKIELNSLVLNWLKSNC